MNEKEIWKPAIRWGKVIPDYLVSNTGRVKTISTGKILKSRCTKWRSGIKTKASCLIVDLSIPPYLYSNEYTHRKRSNRRKLALTVKVHRLVMETFKPLDTNLPCDITEEEWNSCPDTIKRVIRDSVVVDHLDDDATNNHIDNLVWTTSLQNSPHRKYKTEWQSRYEEIKEHELSKVNQTSEKKRTLEVFLNEQV